MTLRQTPSQTVGPYFAYGLAPVQYGYPHPSIASGTLAGEDAAGERIRVAGRVLDGEGAPIPDALVEIWQADGEGRYVRHAAGDASSTGFRGFGRVGTGTDALSRFVFDTVKPGPVGGGQAPHISVIVFMRGLLVHAYTRLYFSDEAEANARDSVLSGVPPERRQTLVAERQDGPAGPIFWFDIHMQGDRETVFFDV